MPFNCARCKTFIQAAPSLINGCGSFCEECEKERTRKAAITRRSKNDGSCIWCACPVDSGEPVFSSNGSSDRICDRCVSGRTWLLKCIRSSDKAAKYVASAEEREAPAREQLAALAAKAARVAASSPEPAQVTGSLDARIDRMETMLADLVRQLTGK